jgi:polar amino acid transport system permease protein
MTPVIVMLRILAPQAIRSMVPALGNEAVSALKNSWLASVASVQELTLRSPQLAFANCDFFSIFFASGLMYLALTASNLDGRSPRNPLTLTGFASHEDCPSHSNLKVRR